MKKKLWIPITAAILLIVILFTPLCIEQLRDGGTKVYSALAYKIVKWNRWQDAVGGHYQKTRIYFGKNSRKSIDELWEIESEGVKTIRGSVSEITDTFVVIKPISNETVKRIRFNIEGLPNINARFEDVLDITFEGALSRPYPAEYKALRWQKPTEPRYSRYEGEFMDMSAAKECASDIFNTVRIKEVYLDCIIGTTALLSDGTAYDVKLNIHTRESICVGDVMTFTYKNGQIDETARKLEADCQSIRPDGEFLAYKPVIYLYPEEKTAVSVKLPLRGKLTCTYPVYKNGWNITAAPDGTLTDESGKEYNYLYWEGALDTSYDLSEGFCVAGEDTAVFLENALSRLGLTRREANEFIVYWLPLMEQNEYNLISFQTDAYTSAAPLYITPAPDTVLRVFMAWKSADGYIDIPPQELSAPTRQGFTVVEWGGTEIKK